MSGTEFKYKAFISYSSRDRLIGEKLHHALENYRIPKILWGRQTGNSVIAKRPCPIYRDRSDLVANPDLSSAISAALDASEFLIVLCTTLRYLIRSFGPCCCFMLTSIAEVTIHGGLASLSYYAPPKSWDSARGTRASNIPSSSRLGVRTLEQAD
jgi:hypothetical protein